MADSLFSKRGRKGFCNRNKQMLPSAGKTCIILSGYSVEEAYCGLAFDFARVGSTRSDREEFPTDEVFHIRRGFFMQREEIAANMNRAGVIQLIGELSFALGLPHERSCSNCFAEIVEDHAGPDPGPPFLPWIW